MAMRRVLLRGLQRHCILSRSKSCGISGAAAAGDQSLCATFDAFVKPGHIRLSGVQVGSFFSRGYSKKSRAKKTRAQEEEEEDEEEQEEEDEDAEVDIEEPKRSAKEHMDAALEALSSELSKLRTGRASAGMLDHVEVEMDGKNVPLSHFAAISVSNPQTLTVMPFDPSTVKKVEAAIRLSPLNLNPVPAEQIITVPIPKLTKELCESMCKVAHKTGEECKKSIRRGRQMGMDHLKKISSNFSKDELKRYEKELDELTKQCVKAVDDACKKKEAEILSGV